ncbi:MAG: Multidrug resistance protein MdtA [Candidatus Ordinivivax streblomastigis]|uniref:Multidrug resistance protein MdtA n=1 Tax=Candidatus Ordinivivax streblomastigis TaxID=2540710 RepID=A0A5M8P2D7_9BACT|nr:MAG: Multidrug resistance protein MdtA [Candidatus Ordinivivax streblomastigis]
MKKTTKIVLCSVIALFILGMAFYPIVSRYLKPDTVSSEITSAPASRALPAGNGKGVPLQVAVKIIQPENLVDVIQTMANLIPDEEVDLTFESSGKITDIYFKEGTAVKKGALLAKINDKPLQAELSKLEAQIPLAEDRVFRQKSLLEKDAVSKEAYEQVSTELEKLHADIELAKARIAQTELRAPFDGIIGLRQVSEGNYASPTTVVANLTKIIPLKIEFSVNEKYANQVRQGTHILFNVPPDLNKYSAEVYAVESRIDLKTKSLKARATYPNSNGKLTPGRTAHIEIKSNEMVNALTIPNEAIIAEMGRKIAFLYSEGKAKRIEIKQGIRNASDIQVLEGLHAGDTLIITGMMQLRDGMAVTIE